LASVRWGVALARPLKSGAFPLRGEVATSFALLHFPLAPCVGRILAGLVAPPLTKKSPPSLPISGQCVGPPAPHWGIKLRYVSPLVGRLGEGAPSPPFPPAPPHLGGPNRTCGVMGWWGMARMPCPPMGGLLA
jgi:hypothetical protein